MVNLAEEPDAPPYFTEQYTVGAFLVRKTKAKNDWIRFQAGKQVLEHRCYASKAMIGRGFDGTEVLYWLLGFGPTEEQAVTMALARR